jgi:hypothetical protein
MLSLRLVLRLVYRPAWSGGGCGRRRHVLGKQLLEIERLGDHGQVALRGARPLGLRAVPVELDAVAIGIAEIERLADAVVGGSLKRNVRADKAAERIGQLRARGIDDGEVIETSGARSGRGAAAALPGVDADVVMVAAGGEEGGCVADALRDFEAEDVVIEGERAVQVGDLEVNVTYAGFGVDGCHAHWIRTGVKTLRRSIVIER